MTLYEWLVAQYEATSCGAWVAEIDEDGDLMVRMGSEHSVVFANMEGSCSECHANQEWTASAHEHGYPLLMAVFEAAREMLAAERANTAALAEYRSCVLTQEDLSDGYRERVNSRERFHAAKLALAAALAPLLADAE